MVHAIKVGGVDVRLRFGMHCMEKISGMYEKGNTGTQFIANLIFYAHENYCLGMDEPTAITKGQAFTFVDDTYSTKDEAGLEIIKVVSDAFANSQAVKQAVDGTDATEKKRLTSGKQKP